MKSRLLAAAAALAFSTGAALAAPDSITIGMVLEPPNLDPTAGAAAAIDEVVYANVFEGLTRFASDGTIRPDLAQSWDVSEDGKVYTFHLQPGVSFHDGTSFDAGDVKFSLDRARAEDSANAQKALFAGITDVTVLDPLTVQVTLAAPDGAFPVKMAWGDAVIVAPESAATEATHPVGTGPFQFADWVQGDHITLTAFPGYRGLKPALAKATFRFISDPTAAFAAMMSGDVDAFPNFPAPETLAQFEADPRFRVIVGTTEGETILAMNNRNPPLNDIKVRQAIAHAIDRQEIIDGAMFGYGTPIGTHFPPHSPDYVDLTGLSAYDPALSKQLLAEAGVSDLTLRLALPPPSYARRGGEIVAAQLAAVGIRTKITNLEWAQWLEQVFKGHDFDLTIVSHTEPNDLNIYARPDYYFGYGKPEFVTLMSELDRATAPADRSRLTRAAEEMIAKDYVNGYLFQLAKTGVANAKIAGLWENAPTQANDLTEVHWTDRPPALSSCPKYLGGPRPRLGGGSAPSPQIPGTPMLIEALTPQGTPEITRPEAAKLVAGDPVHSTWNLEDDRGLYCGIWESTPGAWRVSYDEWEYCRILAGRSVIEGDDGSRLEVGPGDAFVLRPGFTGIWRVIETTRKDYVILCR